MLVQSIYFASAYLNQSVKPSLRVVNIARNRCILHPLLEQFHVGSQVHLMLEAVGLGAAVLLAVFALDQADEGQHFLVHKTAKANAEVVCNVLDGVAKLFS